MMKHYSRGFFALAGVWLAAAAMAQTNPPGAAPAVPAVPEPILPGRPDAGAMSPADPNSFDLLGKPFTSVAAGIEFRAPADAKETRHPGGDSIVEFSNEANRWVLKVNRLSFKDGQSMTYHQEAGHDVNGLLEESVQQLTTSSPNMTILRQEVVRTGQLDIGMIAGKYNIGSEGNLALVGIVRETPADGAIDSAHLYYTFNLTAVVKKTPSDQAKEAMQADLEKDPSAIHAVKLLQQVLDSIRLLDQSAIREDQDARLFRTRSLFVALNEPYVKHVLQHEQWLRLLRDGKDVGYTYMVEETGRDLPRAGRRGMQQTGMDDGVLIGVRSRTMPESGVQVDSESWMWASFDRHHEKWSNVAIVNNAKTGKEAVGDVGSSDTEVDMVSDVKEGESYKGRDGKTKIDSQQPGVRQRNVLTLNVTHIGREKTQAPITRDLPPFYISQGIGHLLPRLVASHPDSTYMFATYSSEAREVMMRYVDVERETSVNLGGKTVRAIPIRDRLGLEGSTTIHYITTKGVYLGSVNDEQKITILVSDASAITKIWKDADLTRPNDVDTMPTSK